MKYNDNGEWKDVQVKVANAIQNEYGESNNDGYSQNYLNDHIVNISNEVDEDYRVNLLEGNNMFNENVITNLWSEYGTGNITNVSGANLQRFNCQEGDTFTLKATFDNPDSLSIILIAFYSSNGTLLSRTTQNTVWEMTQTAPTNSAYMYAGHSTTKPDTLMLNKGNSALTYEPFISNQILVDNEKFTDTLNVGSVVDSRSRVNVLYSKNLFDKNNATITNAYFDSSTGALISGGASYVTENYTEVNANTTYIVGNVTLSRVVFYNSSKGVISLSTTSTSFTTPANTKYIRIQITTNTSNIIIQEGNSIITPSIYVDNEEIYNNLQPKDYISNITLNSGYTLQSTTNNKIVKNKEGLVVVNFVVKASSSISGRNEIATLPSEVRPSKYVQFIARAVDGGNLININSYMGSDGKIILNTSQSIATSYEIQVSGNYYI